MNRTTLNIRSPWVILLLIPLFLIQIPTVYSQVKTPEKATMLFDNIADPYQLNNLVGKPESRKLQDRMDRLLRKKLKAIGDENFKTKEYYPEKWGFDFSEGPSIPYNVTPGKITRVVTPKK